MEREQITFENVGKWYGDIVALSDLSFSSSVPLLGLLGPNGAGKSTLLKLLTGLLRPSRGRVRVLGEDPWNNRRLLATLGYVPEHHRLYPEMTPVELVDILCRLQGLTPEAARKAALEALERVGLSGKKDSPIAALSHGMRGRLKIAQAIAHRPKWLVLDEPLNGLDPLGRLETIKLLRELAAAGTWAVFSSHILHEVESVTSDILLVNKGRLLAQGPVGKVRELMDSHPHRILLQTPAPRRLGRELAGLEHVVRLEFEADRLVVETHRPDAFFDAVTALAAAGEQRIDAMLSLDDNLEAVFRYLVE